MSLLFVLFSIGSLLIAIIYAVLIFRLVDVWQSVPVFKPGQSGSVGPYISVIIPARNEEEAIEACLAAIARQEYPLDSFEVLVVDDHSTDSTAEKIQAFPLSNLRLLRLADYPGLDKSSGFKKQAITWAIEHARGELIVTTDADCMAPPTWLQQFAAVYQEKKARFIAAPVIFSPVSSTLEKFQALDFMGMMLATGAGIETGWFHMCNGANLAYTKKVFYEVNGFEGIQQIASGDDMLLMHKVIQQYPDSIFFMKTKKATVLTSAQPTLKAFIQQRLRWATKSNTYSDRKVIAVLALIFFLCWFILLSPLAALFWGKKALVVGFALLLVKAGTDYRLLSAVATFFERKELMRGFWPAQLLHILYVALIGLLANVKKRYEWKGRKVR